MNSVLLIFAMSYLPSSCIEWTHPTKRTDNSTLLIGEISHTEVWVNGEIYHKAIKSPNNEACAWNINPACFELKTVDVDGLKSVFSQEHCQ